MIISITVERFVTKTYRSIRTNTCRVFSTFSVCTFTTPSRISWIPTRALMWAVCRARFATQKLHRSIGKWISTIRRCNISRKIVMRRWNCGGMLKRTMIRICAGSIRWLIIQSINWAPSDNTEHLGGLRFIYAREFSCHFFYCYSACAFRNSFKYVYIDIII